ncbi:MAG: DUF4214 domain-containing protein [Desulfurella sp.]|jgi:hypothetical protein
MSLNLSVTDEAQALWMAFYDRPMNAQEANSIDMITTMPGFINPQSLWGLFFSFSDLNTMINDFYNNLFGRSPSSAELSYWTNYYYNHNTSIGELAWDIINNASGTDATNLNNRVQAADIFDSTLGQSYTSSVQQTAQNFINSISATTDVASITPATIQNYLNNPNSSFLSNTTQTPTTSPSGTSTTANSSNIYNQIQNLYIAFYGRPADLGGLNYWASVLGNNGDNVQSILQNFANSQEAQSLYGTITPSNIGTVINQIYENLFNRGVDPIGLQYWANVYSTYHMSPGVLAYDILQGALAANNTDTQTIENKLKAANVFTDTLGQNYSSSTIPTAHNFIINISNGTNVASITPTTIESLINSSSSSISSPTATTSTGSTNSSTTIVMPADISTISDNTTLKFNDNYNTVTNNGNTTSTYSTININSTSALSSMNILFDNSHNNNITINWLNLSPNSSQGSVSTLNISDTGGSGSITNTISQLTDNALTTLNLSGTHNIEIDLIKGASNSNLFINITSTNTDNTLNFTNSSNKLAVWVGNNQTNNFTLVNGDNILFLTNTANSANLISNNNITVGSGNNAILLFDAIINGSKDTLTLASANEDINHFTSILYDCTQLHSSNASNDFANLTLTFSNTINPNNATATGITLVNVSSATIFQQALNQAIAATSNTNPFAYFSIPDSLVPGNPAYKMNPNGASPSNPSDDHYIDTVIVDHSAANTGTTFVPGQDAFIVLLGTPYVLAPATLTMQSAGHILV